MKKTKTMTITKNMSGNSNNVSPR